MALSAERPLDPTIRHTADLPPLPQRDRTIPASAWAEAPDELLNLGADIDAPVVAYKRRIGRWLVWLAGPPNHGHARYMAVAVEDPSDRWTYRLFPDGSGEGAGPDGTVHTRMRTWKQALRNTGDGSAI